MVYRGSDSVRLSFWTLFQIYIRSFFSQGSFSINYRQNIGFAFCLEPAGKKIWGKREDLQNFYLRHLEYYNGNPFMVTLVLGAVARMEERLRDNDGITEEDISRFKAAVGQAIGSVGDRFFWRSLRPFGIVLGILTAYLFGAWGALVFLSVFNVPVFCLRWYWLIRGYRLGPRVVIEIKNPILEPSVLFLETSGGILLSFLIIGFLTDSRYVLHWITAGTAGLFLMGFVIPRQKVPPSIIFMVSAALAVLLGWFIP